MDGEDSYLITNASIENIDDQIVALRDKLQAHTLLTYQEVHGNWTDTLQGVFSQTRNIRFARRLVAIKVGNRTYHLPGDVSITGPPLNPVITQHPLDQLSHADGGDPQPAVGFSCVASGLAPLVFTWQLYDIQINQFVDVDIGVGKIAFGGTSVNVANIVSGGSTSALTLSCSSPGEGNYDPATFVRCRVDNLAVDGGEVTSNSAKVRIEDETDSCTLMSASWHAGYLDPESVLDVVRFRIRCQCKEWKSDECWAGYMLGFTKVIKAIHDKKPGSKFLFRFIVKPFVHYAKWKLGKEKFSLYSITHYRLVIWGWSHITSFFRPQAAKRISDRIKKISVLKLYRTKVKRLASR